jgi:superfamily II DNA or RNA helicase
MLKDQQNSVSKQAAPSNGVANPPAKREAKPGKGHARAMPDRPPAIVGWSTTDEQEIDLRRWRGRTEIAEVDVLEPKQPVFGRFRVRSESGTPYEVEIRSLGQHVNSCSCVDHRVNGLGTCKHIEGVMAVLNRRDPAAFAEAAETGSARIEIFVDRREVTRPAIEWPVSSVPLKAAREWLRPYLETGLKSGLKSGEALHAEPRRIARLIAAWEKAPAAIRRQVRISSDLSQWLQRETRLASRRTARAKFLGEVEAGKASFDLTRLPLLPYQREGMLHLAFGERALLADEMGLGKTVQAIAACELLARRKGVKRVLIVCPASLKAEWEEQIARFTERPAKSVFGARPHRLAAYAAPVFFNIVNYEQVLSDAEEINTILAPDVVILDEAQRIKNWQTKTARRVKQLRSPYAFVLTGTPIENRIEELYSIIQYLDPELIGPLFRFNRTFYELDDRGRAVDYKNLAALRDCVAPVMLRRRKADVETELPGRTVTNYFVAMAAEQRIRYEEYSQKAARLIAIAQRRALRPEEFEQLMVHLACMRMICDTPAILDPACRICPKLEELERVLDELLEDPDRKVIIFSEWERMLDMISERAREMGHEVAWHTGSVPQQRRRAEIVRFKEDPACRLFLSTDSGSVGLNLQVASAVINVDLPWNPAKLEQRIARAWRKGQMRGVTVVNLVCEDSIEHSMVHLLGSKQALADGVLDGQGDLAALKMPSGRSAMIERVQALMQAATAAAPAAQHVAVPHETLAENLISLHGDRTVRIEARQFDDGRTSLLAVLDLDASAVVIEAKRLEAASIDGLTVEVIDKATWLVLKRLQASGLLQLTDGAARILHEAPVLDERETAARLAKAQAAKLRSLADRALRKAHILAAGGFADETPTLLIEALGHAASARLVLCGEQSGDTAPATPPHIRAVVERKLMPANVVPILDMITQSNVALSTTDIERLLQHAAQALAVCFAEADAMDASHA